MRRQGVYAALLAAAVALLLLCAYVQRGPLLRGALNLLLADSPLLLADLQGLQLARDGLQVQQLTLLLPARRETLVVTGVELRWQRRGLLALPRATQLHIASATLAPADAAPGPGAGVAAPPEQGALDPVALLDSLSNFPLASIVVEQLQLRGRAAPLQATLTAAPGAFSAKLRSSELEATLMLEQADAAAAAQLQLQASLDAASHLQLDFTIPAALPAGQLAGTGRVEATGTWQQEPFALEGRLELPPCAVERSAECALQFDAEASLAAWTAQPADPAALRLEGLHLAGTGTLGLDAATLQPRLGAASFDGAVASLRAGELQLATGFALREAELLLGDRLQGSLRLRSEGLVLETPAPWLPALDLDAEFRLSGTQLEFDAALLLRDGSVPSDLRLQGSHDLASAAGTAALQLAPVQLAEGRTLGQRLGGWSQAWDLVVGELDAGLQLQWRHEGAMPGAAGTRVTGTLQARLDGIGGYYGSSLFRGLATTLTAEIDTAQPLPLGTPPFELRLAGLDIGLPLQDLLLRLQLDAPGNRLHIESLMASLLGGRIHMQQQHFDLAQADNELQLQLEGLRLEQVLALTGYDDIVVDGGISGEVPLHFSAAGIEVAGGHLRAQEPGGSIRYLGTLGQGDASLALVRQALSNYRFDALDSSIDYTPDGELLLGMQLQGYNPELENGRRVNLNLNLSNNIVDLLKSLQAGRSIEELMQELYE